MKAIVISLLLIVCVVLAGCNNQPTVEEATAAFCESLEGFSGALKSLQSTLTPTATVDAVKSAAGDVDKAWEQVTEAAGDLKEVRVDTIDAAWKGVRQTIDNVDGDDTLAAAGANISASLAQVDAALAAVGSVSCPATGAAAPADEAAADEAAAGDAVAAEPTAAPAQPAPEIAGFTGTYSATVKLAGVTETGMVLVLNEDGSAFLVMRPAGQAAETVVSGQWQDAGDGTAAVTLTEVDGSEIASPEKFTFVQEGNVLAAVEYNADVYGADGFSLQRMEDASVSAEAETVAAQAGAEITGTLPLTPTAEVAAAITATISLTPTAEVAAAPAESAAATGEATPLVATWQLQQINQASDLTFTPDDPAKYTVTFNADGTLNVTADCNTGSGTYTANSSGRLTIQVSASRAYCGTTSLTNQFVSYLNVANSYLIEGQQLTIGFSNDSGAMTFTAAP